MALSIYQRRLPFDVKLPVAHPIDVSTLTEQQLSAELEKGYSDITAGCSIAAENVFADIDLNEYNGYNINTI